MRHEELLRSLFRELFQTEMSGRTHPRKEARRLSPSEPSTAMEAIARDCDVVLREVCVLAEERGYPVSAMGLGIGRLLSVFRTVSTDLIATRELSYRATLLGLRHGVDVVHLLRHAAEADDDEAVVEFCDRFLARRAPLILDLENALGWFAQHPELATMPAAPGPFGRQGNAVRRWFARLDDGIGALVSALPLVKGVSSGIDRRRSLAGWHVGRLV